LNTVAWRVNWSRINASWLVPLIAALRRARPVAVNTTPPPGVKATRPSASASSHAQFSGQVLAHAARASAARRGRAATQSRNCAIRNVAAPAMAPAWTSRCP
jgi:hypothetical protein